MKNIKEFLGRAGVAVALLLGMAFPALAVDINGGELKGTVVSKETVTFGQMVTRTNLVVSSNGDLIPVFCGNQLVSVCSQAAIGTVIDVGTKIQATGQSKVVAIYSIVLQDPVP